MSAIETMRRIGRPIAYHPALARHVGGVNAAIFLCWLMKRSEEQQWAVLGVPSTASDLENETGLTYREQANARRKLRALGVLIETKRRLEHQIYFRLDETAMFAVADRILSVQAEHGTLPQRLPAAKWAVTRARIFERDRFTCQYCGAKDAPLECDHILPLSKGGGNGDSNLLTACRACNSSKGTKNIDEWGGRNEQTSH